MASRYSGKRFAMKASCLSADASLSCDTFQPAVIGHDMVGPNTTDQVVCALPSGMKTEEFME